MDAKQRVAIIGAGLTGLTTAYYLKKQGLDVTVFESGTHTGGVIQTIREKGFVMEAGPNTGVLGNPEAAELFEELNGLCELETANQAAKKRWIWKKNRWEPIPSGPWSYIRTPLFSAKDKLKLFAEPWQKPGTDPNETLDKLVVRRLGKSFLDYVVNPFVAGVYAGDPTYLVPKYALPKLYNLEQTYGSFIGGTIKKQKEPKTDRDRKATREVFSAKGGLDNLTNALAHKIGETNILLNCKNINIEKTTAPNGQASYRIRGERDGNAIDQEFPLLVTTTSAHALAGLLPFLNPDDLRPMDDLLYAKVVLVTMGFDHWDGTPLKAFGGLVPAVENRNILGVLFTSSFFENRAPEGGALLSIFMGGMRQPHMADLSDDELLAIAGSEIQEMLGLANVSPTVARVFKYRHAIPQYGASTAQRLAAVENIERTNPGLIIGGNLHNGIGMADRIKQGRMMAERIISEHS